MIIHSLLRRAEHRVLSTVTLNGSVVDLGGDKGAEYLSHIQGNFTVTALNIDPDGKPDILHDLEKPLPMANESYDHALLINVLEHIFGYRELLSETVRVVRPGGSVVVVVPFLFPIHPSPRDHWRFTAQTLQKEFELQNLTNIRIVPLGSGVFSVRYVLLDRLLPHTLRVLCYFTVRYVVIFLDRCFVALARASGKKYVPSDYALGYMVTGSKR